MLEIHGRVWIENPIRNRILISICYTYCSMKKWIILLLLITCTAIFAALVSSKGIWSNEPRVSALDLNNGLEDIFGWYLSEDKLDEHILRTALSLNSAVEMKQWFNDQGFSTNINDELGNWPTELPFSVFTTCTLGEHCQPLSCRLRRRRIPPKPMRTQWIGKFHWLRAFTIRTKVKHPMTKCVTTVYVAGPAAT